MPPNDTTPQGVSVHSGFPNPAADRTLEGLDLHTLLIKNPSSTFFMRIAGHEWEERGVFDGDVIVIDRALRPQLSDLVVITKNAEFLIAPASKLTRRSVFWGVVTNVIHQLRP